jgi:hypothetical protein
MALDGEPHVLEEEPGAVAVETLSLSGEREVLARRSAGDQVHRNAAHCFNEALMREAGDVVPDRSLR